MHANTASIMKHLLLLPLAAFVLMASCSTAPEPAEVAADAALAGIERVVNEVAITSGTPREICTWVSSVNTPSRNWTTTMPIIKVQTPRRLGSFR